MKAGKLHRVPLSPAALAVLDEVRPLMRGLSDLVFPGARTNVPLSDMALSEVVRRMNEGGEDGARASRDLRPGHSFPREPTARKLAGAMSGSSTEMRVFALSGRLITSVP